MADEGPGRCLFRVDAFLSHANRDRAQEVAAELRERGIRAWCDQEIADGRLSREVDEIIGEAHAASRYVVLLTDSQPLRSAWCRAEMERALAEGAFAGAERVLAFGDADPSSVPPGVRVIRSMPELAERLRIGNGPAPCLADVPPDRLQLRVTGAVHAAEGWVARLADGSRAGHWPGQLWCAAMFSSGRPDVVGESIQYAEALREAVALELSRSTWYCTEIAAGFATAAAILRDPAWLREAAESALRSPGIQASRDVMAQLWSPLPMLDPDTRRLLAACALRAGRPRVDATHRWELLRGLLNEHELLRVVVENQPFKSLPPSFRLIADHLSEVFEQHASGKPCDPRMAASLTLMDPSGTLERSIDTLFDHARNPLLPPDHQDAAVSSLLQAIASGARHLGAALPRHLDNQAVGLGGILIPLLVYGHARELTRPVSVEVCRLLRAICTRKEARLSLVLTALEEAIERTLDGGDWRLECIACEHRVILRELSTPVRPTPVRLRRR